MRVVRGEAERCVDPAFELLGECMLEPVGLGVHFLQRQAKRLGEVALEQPVVAEHLEGASRPTGVSTTPRYGARSTRPCSASRLVIAVAEGALTPIRSARADVVARTPSLSRA